MNTITKKAMPWWGQLDVAVEKTALCEVGPLTLAISRTAREWLIGHRHSDEEPAGPGCVTIEPTAALSAKLQDIEFERYMFRETSGPLLLTPLTADRSVVTRPTQALYIPAGEQATVFVSSPLWVRIEVGTEPKRLRELPLLRPSDTWFGPSTREGELCYATRTHARLELDEVPLRAHRAVTAVTIRNESAKPLQVEKLNLPVPYLSLFATPTGCMWTETVSLVRTAEGEAAAVEIGEQPPEQVEDASLVTPPRSQAEKGTLVRALSALFG